METVTPFQLRLRKGSVPGSGHRRLGINNQDASATTTFTINGKTYTVGCVFDGCTTTDKRGSHNEVGARLKSVFLPAEIRMLILAGTPLEKIPHSLHPRLIGYLGNLVRATCSGDPNEQWAFISTHLLATVLGFISDGESVVFFSAGDGIIIVNDDVKIIDQNDRPEYVAFHLLDRKILGDAADILPNTFSTHQLSLAGISRFAVSSDGLKEKRKDNDTLWVAPDTLEALWKYQPKAPAGVQWWLNKQQNEGRFSDDATAIAVEVLPQTLKDGAP